jgi:hypothetical protein
MHTHAYSSLDPVQIPAKIATKLRDLYGQAAKLSAREGGLAGQVQFDAAVALQSQPTAQP